ncbi:hypothetical protein [Luteitalea pratensis]|uniref:hypothetical protein n=1 Tax=Luteitalea pratensis TaxID=1855912 RepID=UPI000D73E677|nr:hypothetical protein [Luteitalea pratensis]
MRTLSRRWLIVAAIGLSLTLQLSAGFYDEPTLVWLGLSLIAAILGLTGVRWPWGTDADRDDEPFRLLLTVGVLVSTTALVSKPLALYMPDPRPSAHPDLLVAVTVACLVAISVRPAHGAMARRLAAIVILAVGLWLGAWTVRESPKPHIDVIPVHVEAFAALSRGKSPYVITFDDIYRPDEAFYTPSMRRGGKVLFGFPYPPLSLLLAWPGYALLGDLRYSEVLAIVVAAGLIVWMSDGLGLLCAAALLLAPRLVFHLEQGWTEPFPIMLLAITVATALRRPDRAWLPLGLLIASKQHMALGLLFAPMLMPSSESGLGSRESGVAGKGPESTDQDTEVGSRESGIAEKVSPKRYRDTRVARWVEVARFVLKAVAVGAVVTVPFALLDLDAFWRSAVLLQLREPFRLDSLSFTRELLQFGISVNKQMAMALSLTAGLAGIGLAWWRAPRTPAGFAASLGVTCFLLAAFGKKAFLNYYFLVLAFLLVAVAASSSRPAPKRS